MIRIINRKAVVRLGILLGLLLLLMVWSWLSMIRMPLQSYRGDLPALTEQEISLRDQLRRDVRVLGEEIGERNVYRPAEFERTVRFIEESFTQSGYTVRRHSYQVSGVDCPNLEVEIRGGDQAGEIVVVGAHYDSVGGCPGANDNGSGVAALLALARSLAGSAPGRTIRLVAFPNEEPPYFWTSQMGSLVYARACRERGDRIVGMLSLETIGCYSDAPGSQKYPAPLGFFYPSEGNFIAFVGNYASRKLVRRSITCFRREVKFPSEGAALPGAIPGVGWSDHWSFWQADYPALMVTDTAPFRYPEYHTAQDLPGKLDYDRMTRVVAGLEIVIRELAGIGAAR